MLTAKQIEFLLSLIREKHGPGYSADPEVARIQVALSVMLEARRRIE